MRWLQALVAIMSIMIVVGVTVIGVTIVHRLSVHSQFAAMSASTAGLDHSVDPKASLQSTLKLPAGSHVANVSIGNGRIALHVAVPDQSDLLYVLDADTGRLVHQITLDNH